MEARPRKIEHYVTENGHVPFTEWMDSLEAFPIWGITYNRIDRVKNGNLGDCHPVGHGVSELRIDVGPGYRVYFGQDGNSVILLCGGMKKTQRADIKRAKDYWRDYNA